MVQTEPVRSADSVWKLKTLLKGVFSVNHDFFDVYYQPGENPVFCYRTGMTVYEEAFVNGSLVAMGWNAAGYPLNVLTNCPSRLDPKKFAEPYAFNLEVNGASIDFDLKFIDFTSEKTGENIHCVLTLDSLLSPVRIRVHTLLDGTAMFTRWLEIENLSGQALNISRMSLIAGGLETMNRSPLTGSNEAERFYSLGYFNEDSWGREGDFAWHDLCPDTHAVETRFNRDRYRHPLIFLRNNLMGTMWFAQIAYSGGCRFTVDYNAKREEASSALSFKAEIAGYNPLIVLRAGENFCTPEVHMGMMHGDLDAAVNEMHAHARKSVLNLPEANPSACMVGAGMGAEHDMSVETTKAFIDQFAEMGAEIFIVDAGWQNPPHKEMEWGVYNGINHPNPERYPNGLAEISDYCRSRGMKFALWIEIERLGAYAEAWQAHPEWRLPHMHYHEANGYLDFSNPEAAQWAENELSRMIAEYKLDLLRVDYNMSANDYHSMRTLEGGAKEYTALRHFQAVDRMYLNLKRRFPHVLFENCAGGGGRTDYAQMKAFNHTWVSDWQKAPRSVMITNGMTMALPPERVDRLVSGMGCHEYGTLDLHMRNAMFGHVSLNVVAPAATYPNPLQMEFIRRSVALYKEFIRPFLPRCRVYHPTPEVGEIRRQGWCGLEIAAQDGKRGIFGVFTMPGMHQEEIQICLRGVDASRTYRITLDNSGYSFEMSGAEAAMRGIAVRVPSPLASELILYEAVE